MAVIISKQMTIPLTGKLLSDYAHGEIVKINENGKPVEFYVAKHDYESSLNGAGRTLLVRKNCYDERVWHSSRVNAYATSSIDSWLNGGYKALLDAKVQDAIKTTKFYYTPGNGDSTLTTLIRDIFLLSEAELGRYGSGVDAKNKEGSELPIASTLKTAKMNGSAVSQWTRTPWYSNTTEALMMAHDVTSSPDQAAYCNIPYGSRPTFTLPSNALFNPDTNKFKGVA